MLKISGYALHHHHFGDLLDWVYDYQGRIDYINNHKPYQEQLLRLALFKIVPDTELPSTLFKKARSALEKADVTREKANAAQDRADAALDKADDALDKALSSIDVEALHARLCHPNCPWDGKTIFSKGYSIEVLEGGTAKGEAR